MESECERKGKERRAEVERARARGNKDGSYGVQDNAVLLTEALELSHLDYEEFRAAYESMTLALPEHLRALAAYREAR